MKSVDLNVEYEIDSRVPNLAEVMAHYSRTSEMAAARPSAVLDISYGADPRQRLDIFRPGGSDTPAILFFHGGYWKGGSKEDRRFPAEAWNEFGVAWVPVEYRLAPTVTIDEIVKDARQAVAWFHENADQFGCSADKIHIAGNSAGGHIVGMLLASGWQGDWQLPETVIKSGTAVSGLFELEPLRETFVNEWLQLDQPTAHRNSPLNLPPRSGCPITVSWGGKESDAFFKQSEAYADACAEAGATVSVFSRPEADHFSIIGEFADANSPLFLEMTKHIVSDEGS